MGHYDDIRDRMDDEDDKRLADYRAEKLKQLADDPVLVKALFELVRNLPKWHIPAHDMRNQIKNFDEVTFKIR